MESQPDASGTAPRSSVWMIVLGVVFMACWLGASALWFVMSMMGALMANDSGVASGSSHTGMIAGVIGGQALTALAGIAGGSAFFWRTRRRFMIILFVALFVLGILCQYGAVQSFLSPLQTPP